MDQYTSLVTQAVRTALPFDARGLTAHQMSTTTEVNPRLLKLTEAGVSVWLDQIRRSLIDSGELARMVKQECLRGVTANPSIFENAILESPDYDRELVRLARRHLDARAIYERIAIRDVQMAADVLAEVHSESHGRDGFVSLEVSPQLAYDTEGTLAEARSYWQRLDRPNVMIKIPGTRAGVPAIEKALYEGINVNVTLLFSISAYEAVAESYLRALERRQSEGLSLEVASARLLLRFARGHERRPQARRAGPYRAPGAGRDRQRAGRLPAVQGDLRRAAVGGAAPRRRRGAAAAVGFDQHEGPALPGTRCTSMSWSGPHVVNTMPLQTLLAVADHGHVRGPTAEHDPTPVLAALAEAGIDMRRVTDELLVDGIKQFEHAFRQLLLGIEARRRDMR